MIYAEEKEVLKFILISELWLKKMQLDPPGDYRCPGPTYRSWQYSQQPCY